MTARKEQRRSPRVKLPCPVKVLREDGETVAARTIDVSDTGVLVSMPIDSLPRRDEVLELKLSVPRYTASTFMLEEVSSDAKVRRHQPMVNDRFAGVAMEFAAPLELALEV